MQRATESAPTEPYEKGMHIIFDVLTRYAIVTFRGEVDMIGPFLSRGETMLADEDRCRKKGWGSS